MRKFKLEIVSPDGVEFIGEIESLLVRTDEGDVEILAGHADYLAAISVGRARILSDGEARLASVSGGFISVTKKCTRLAVTTFEFSEDIDLARATSAKERAEAAISAAKSDKDLRIAEAKLKRAINRISVSNARGNR